MTWSGGFAEWVDEDTVFISVAFSWLADKAYMRAVWRVAEGYKVRVGGPGLASKSISSLFEGIATIGGKVDAVVKHNPRATFASRGCPVGCYFCIVPKIEGSDFTLIPDFTPRPILCDSNVSALPVEYQEHIIGKYKKCEVGLEDINSGFEPRTFDGETYERWRYFYKGPWRFAFDEMREEREVEQMAKLLSGEPASKKRVYVLIGNEPFEQCYERIMKVIEWGCEPHVQPFIALGSRKKTPVVKFDWTLQKLRDLSRWANRWIWRKVKFEDYKTGGTQ